MTNLQSSDESKLIRYQVSQLLMVEIKLNIGLRICTCLIVKLIFVRYHGSKGNIVFLSIYFDVYEKVILTTPNQNHLIFLIKHLTVVKDQRVRTSGISMNVFLHHECQEVDQSGNLEMVQFSTVSSFISWNKEKQRQQRNLNI